MCLNELIIHKVQIDHRRFCTYPLGEKMCPRGRKRRRQRYTGCVPDTFSLLEDILTFLKIGNFESEKKSGCLQSSCDDSRPISNWLENVAKIDCRFRIDSKFEISQQNC